MSFIMKIYFVLIASLLTISQLSVAVEEIPAQMQEILDQPQFQHAFWGVFVKDLDTGKVLYDLNSNKLFSPGSTTKLFTVAALLHAFGDNYRFKTPLYSTQPIRDGKLNGDLVIVGQGDLTMGGRQPNPIPLLLQNSTTFMLTIIPGVSLNIQKIPLQLSIAWPHKPMKKGFENFMGTLSLMIASLKPMKKEA